MNLEICQLGSIPYAEALAVQEQLLELRQTQKIGDLLLLLEHPPVITMGRKAKSSDILMSPEWLEAHQVEVFPVNRGGDVTYHGPGQIVGYLFIDLHNHGRDIRQFVRKLEQVFINLLSDYYNINAFRHEKHPGVWVEEGKITAIGLAIKRWVTMHGFAFNINPDLSHFQWIVPCGITDKDVYSLEALIKRKLNMDTVYQQIITAFTDVYQYKPILIDKEHLLTGVLKK